MIFSGITPAKVEQVVAEVSRAHYGGNVVPEWLKYGREPHMLSSSGVRFSGRIVVYNSMSFGARRDASGRRAPIACWHVFRDVIGPLLLEHGARRITTDIARYTPDNWGEIYPGTAYRNFGSQVYPVELARLCECNGRTSFTLATSNRGRTYFPQSPIMVDDDSYQESLARIDKVLAGAVAVSVGECATCGRSTGSADMVWCSHDCQAVYQAKQINTYGVAAVAQAWTETLDDEEM